MGTWPWRRMVNPHEDKVEAESKAWLRTFSNRMASVPHWENNIQSLSARLASMISPTLATKEQLRIGSDLIYLYLVIDDCLDIECATAVQGLVDMINDILKTPYIPRPKGEHPLGQLVKEFWELTLRTATPLAAKHFLETFPTYLESNVTHARDRDNDYFPTVEEYFGDSRRYNVGSKAIYLAGEVCLNVPDEAYYHPVIMEMQNCSLDIIIIDNDMISFKKELANDDVRWNIIAIVMRQFGLSINEAMVWACDYHHQVQRRFISLLNDVPLFGPEVDKEVSAYIFHLANYAQGNHCWNFETSRYLGDDGLEVQRTRRVHIAVPPDTGRVMRSKL